VKWVKREKRKNKERGGGVPRDPLCHRFGVTILVVAMEAAIVIIPMTCVGGPRQVVGAVHRSGHLRAGVGAAGAVHCSGHLCAVAGAAGAVRVAAASFVAVVHCAGHRCAVVHVVGAIWVVGVRFGFLVRCSGCRCAVRVIGVPFEAVAAVVHCSG
jgi:hypothetical protein